MLILAPFPRKRLKANKKETCIVIQGTILLGNVINLNLELSIVSKYKAKNCQNYNEKSVQ